MPFFVASIKLFRSSENVNGENHFNLVANELQDRHFGD